MYWNISDYGEGFSLNLFFTTTANGSDADTSNGFMLQNTYENASNGLNYEVLEGETKKIKISILKENRDAMIPASSRRFVLSEVTKSSGASTSGSVVYDLKVTKPDGGYTTGIYKGYIYLTLEMK